MFEDIKKEYLTPFELAYPELPKIAQLKTEHVRKNENIKRDSVLVFTPLLVIPKPAVDRMLHEVFGRDEDTHTFYSYYVSEEPLKGVLFLPNDFKLFEKFRRLYNTYVKQNVYQYAPKLFFDVVEKTAVYFKPPSGTVWYSSSVEVESYVLTNGWWQYHFKCTSSSALVWLHETYMLKPLDSAAAKYGMHEYPNDWILQSDHTGGWLLYANETISWDGHDDDKPMLRVWKFIK